MEDIRKVGVVGCGVMGVGIVELCARHDLEVRVLVRSEVSATTGQSILTKSLDRAVRKEKITATEREAALDRVRFVTDISVLADRDVVIESVKEDEAIKVALFRELDDAVTNPDVIFTSNTSSLPVGKLVRATSRPSQMVGTHFFNPAQSLPLVELVDTLMTDEEVSLRAERFLADVLGKQVIRTRDRPGFMVNALLVPYLLSAMRMVDEGFASAEDIDRAMVLGCNYPMGPLALSDMIGLDTMVEVAEALHREFKDPQFIVPSLLSRMVEAGMLGRKTGIGFHRYDI